MRFYSGFLLQNEQHLFQKYLIDSEYSIAGFSYGAILAFKHALHSKERIDTIQLFSPAYFVHKSKKFKSSELRKYSLSPRSYERAFINNIFSPYPQKELQLKDDGPDELQELLNYSWKVEDFQRLKSRGIEIEIYLGECDKIIDIAHIQKDLLAYTTIFTIKDANHLLQTN